VNDSVIPAAAGTAVAAAVGRSVAQNPQAAANLVSRGFNKWNNSASEGVRTRLGLLDSLNPLAILIICLFIFIIFCVRGGSPKKTIECECSTRIPRGQ
jgi:hypothetical protein